MHRKLLAMVERLHNVCVQLFLTYNTVMVCGLPHMVEAIFPLGGRALFNCNL